MCREESNENLSEDLPDCHSAQPSNNSSPTATNLTLPLNDSLTGSGVSGLSGVSGVSPVSELPESEPRGNVTAVNVYKIYQQFNASSAANISTSTSGQDLNETLLHIKRTNMAANINEDTEDNEDSKDRDEILRRERRSAGASLHISREDDTVRLISLEQQHSQMQYHSM